MRTFFGKTSGGACTQNPDIGNGTREFTVEGARNSAYQWIKDNFGGKANEALALYGFDGTMPPSDDPVFGSIVDLTSSDVIFRCPASWVAERQLAVAPKVWRYEFAVPAPDSDKPVEHSAELKYVFDPAPKGATFGTWPPVQAYWTNFAKTGDPNGRGLPKWSPLGKDKHYMEFTTDGPRPGKNLHGPICRLLSNP